MTSAGFFTLAAAAAVASCHRTAPEPDAGQRHTVAGDEAPADKPHDEPSELVSTTDTTEAPDPTDTAPKEPRFAVLDVPNFAPALVALPSRSSLPEPLLVAVHGAGDGPDWECPLWRELLGDRGVILCPTGRSLGKDSGGFYHPDHHALEALVLASVAALENALGDQVDTTSAVYAAYSQGATMGSHMIVDHAAAFPRLILVEGGFAEWNVPRGKAYAEGGGQRILFACGTAHCARKAQKSAAWLERGGVTTRVEVAEGAGHTYGGRVAERVRNALDWILEGDARWSRGSGGRAPAP